MTNFSEIPVQLSDEFPRSQDKWVGISKMFLSFITLSLYIWDSYYHKDNNDNNNKSEKKKLPKYHFICDRKKGKRIKYFNCHLAFSCQTSKNYKYIYLLTCGNLKYYYTHMYFIFWYIYDWIYNCESLLKIAP